jgi:site-specific DNA-methyltransferase (adenine-specific)
MQWVGNLRSNIHWRISLVDLINGDCIEEMQRLIDEGVQVDSIVTDPPYHLTSIVKRYGKPNSAPAKDRDGLYQRTSKGFMGQEWDGGDIAFRQETWGLALKLLKPGGHLLAFSASRNYHRMAVAIEDAGFEIRDQLMWLYGSGFPKSHNLGDGWGTALKPAHEPIVMAKKSIEGTNKNNREKYGTGGINIDECRVGYVSDYDKKHQADIARGQDNADNGVFFGGKGKTKASTHEPTGRFPANVMHDGSEEVVSGFPNAKEENSVSRFFYSPKASKSDKGKNNTHPTVKPQELMKYLCRLVTPEGGTVLDPFMGSGSTGIAAKEEGFKFIGIEKEKEYFKICQDRIKESSPIMDFIE